MKKIGLWASALLLASLTGGCSPKSGASDPSDKVGDDSSGSGSSDKAEKGKPAPEIEAEPVTGDGPKSIADAKGTVTIVDFWATFCDPCRKSFPKYQELVDKHAGKLAVIAVSVDDPEDVGVDEVKKFADDLGVSFTIVWDKQKKTSKKYDPPKMPTSYLLDKDGNIVSVHPGFESGEAEKIDAEIEELISK
jgi:thiol-disulfide isomerase/thioredoxin